MEFKELVDACNEEIRNYKTYDEGSRIENLKAAPVVVTVHKDGIDYLIEIEDMVGFCEGGNMVLIGEMKAIG